MRRNDSFRTGFSVVEVLVSLMLVTVGLLGMAGTSAIALRATVDSSRERRAVLRVSSRLARLAARGCAAAGSDSVIADGVRERWSVDTPRAGFALVEARAEWLGPDGRRGTLTLWSAIAC